MTIQHCFRLWSRLDEQSFHNSKILEVLESELSILKLRLTIGLIELLTG